MNILVTGGAGFIGSHVVRLFVNKYPEHTIINFDKLTYAGNLSNLKDLEGKTNYHFVKGDICSQIDVKTVFEKYKITDVIHLAAESHVDRSIEGPMEFAMTNVIGTLNLLNEAKNYWNLEEKHTFHHVSTDEVYGSLGEEGLFTETTAYDPRSPYSASKASSDHFVRAYSKTYGLSTTISHAGNNYGPYQFPEKLIPFMIMRLFNNQPLPIYGKGDNVRDWLYVEDHSRAIETIFFHGTYGESYNVGGLNEWKNIDLVHYLCNMLDVKLKREPGTSASLITYVTDRSGHDMRYAIDASKLEKELGWTPSITFEEGLDKTVDWYLANEEWVKEVTSGDYQKYYSDMYSNR